MVPHCPTADATVAGYRVPAGCCVFVDVWAIQRDPAVWKDPLEFVPERFLPGGASGTSPDYFPFGSGRRICAGITMAERMTAYSLAMLLQAFDWELPPGAKLDMAEKFAIVMKKSTPLVAIPTPRLSNPDLYDSANQGNLMPTVPPPLQMWMLVSLPFPSLLIANEIAHQLNKDSFKVQLQQCLIGFINPSIP